MSPMYAVEFQQFAIDNLQNDTKGSMNVLYILVGINK